MAPAPAAHPGGGHPVLGVCLCGPDGALSVRRGIASGGGVLPAPVPSAGGGGGRGVPAGEPGRPPLPYGSTLSTSTDALSVTLAEGATKGEVTMSTDSAAGTVTYSFAVAAEGQTTQTNYTETVSMVPDPATENKVAVDIAKTAITGHTGGGTYEAGSNVTVTATSSSSRYYFVCWTEGEKEVSRDASCTFALTKNRTQTAEFGQYNPAAPLRGHKSP